MPPVGSTTANGSGEWSETLTGVADGSHTYKAKATDAAGNTSADSNPRMVTVDTAAPNTTITSGPSEGANVNATSQTFEFNSTEAGSTFKCSVNGAAFSACSTGETFTFTEGSNTFEVKATDAAGNRDQTPAKRAFTVDATAPDTTITNGPSGTVNGASATFTFTSSENASTFECRLDESGEFTELRLGDRVQRPLRRLPRLLGASEGRRQEHRRLPGQPDVDR